MPIEEMGLGWGRQNSSRIAPIQYQINQNCARSDKPSRGLEKSRISRLFRKGGRSYNEVYGKPKRESFKHS